MKLLVREKWEMEVAAPEGEPWFADWVDRRINESSAHISAGAEVLEHLAERIEEPWRILEAFGGLGCQTLTAQSLWPGAVSTIYENSPQAVQHLRGLRGAGVLGEKTVIHQDNAYPALTPDEDDVVILDFGDMTATRMVKNKLYTGLLGRTFAARPRAVVLTDIAGRLYHLHKGHYSEALETELSDYQSYLRAVGGYVRDRWGYYPVVTSYQRWSAVMGFLPTAYGHLIGPVIDEPRGLQKI